MSSYYKHIVDFSITLSRLFFENGEEINYSASTTSIYLALAMVHLGAKNQSSVQLKKLLGADFSSLISHRSQKDELYVSMKEVYHELEKCGQLRNRIFSAIELIDDYKKVMVELFRVTFEHISFQNPSEVVEAVNRWVKEQTHGRIDNLIDESVITPETVLVLINTIYFRGLWKNKFDNKLTENSVFHLEGSESINVPFMAKKDKFNLYDDHNGRFKALSLEFEQESALGVFLLPSETTTVKQLLLSLQSEDLQKILQLSIKIEVNVRIPKFKLDMNTKVKKILQQLGVVDIFDKNTADLTHMSHSPLWVQDIIHRSTVEIDEEGVVAAAATAVIFGLRSIQIQEWFIADH